AVDRQFLPRGQRAGAGARAQSRPAAALEQGDADRMTLRALINGGVLGERGFEHDVAVLIDGATIVDVVPRTDPRVAAAQTHDLGGAYLVPGFIDCQVNGGGGVLFNDAPSVATIRKIGAAHRAFGTTGFLPTLISSSAETLAAALRATADAIDQGVPGVLGIDLAG